MNLDTVLNHTIVTRVFTIYQLAHFLIVDLKKEIKKKYNSKLVIIAGDFFLSYSQVSKEEKESIYSSVKENMKFLFYIVLTTKTLSMIL